MSRTELSMVLVGALVLMASACAPEPSSEIASTNLESPGDGPSVVGKADAHGPETEGKPVVTVRRSPT